MNHLLQKHNGNMEPAQLETLEAALPRIREEHDQLIILHNQWRDYNDGKSLNEIEEALSTINIIETEAINPAPK